MPKDDFSVEDWVRQDKERNKPEVRQLKTEIRRLHRLLRKAKSGEAIIVDEVARILEKPHNLAIPPLPKAGKRKQSTESAFLHVSDVQIGKRTDTYSIDIAGSRLMHLAERTVEITESRRSTAKIDTLHICLGGDLVEGETIFGGQSWETDGDLWDQAIKSGPEMLARMIIYLMGHFRHLHISNVPGNHGRSGSKYSGVSKRTNFDSICAEITRLLVCGVGGKPKTDGRITWDFDHDTFWAVHDIEGWGILCVHGDQIRGGGAGFPVAGTIKKMAGWVDSIPKPWTYLAFGHFHNYTYGTVNTRYYLANGAVESDNIYAQEQLASCGTPCQRLSFFNRSQGLIADHQVWLDDSRSPDYR